MYLKRALQFTALENIFLNIRTTASFSPGRPCALASAYQSPSLSIPHRLLIARLRRRPPSLLPVWSLWRWTAHLHVSRTMIPTSPVRHVRYVGSAFQRLCKTADVADDILVAVEGERYKRLARLLVQRGNYWRPNTVGDLQ